jgi:hypothetical protein
MSISLAANSLTSSRTLATVLVFAVLTGYAANFFPSVVGMPIEIWWAETVKLNSYFTIQSNWLIAAVMFFSFNTHRAINQPLLAAATLYIAITGIIHLVLLQPTANYQGWNAFSNLLHHYLTPVLAIIIWLHREDRGQLKWKHALYWLSFPLLFVGYWLIRGPLVGYYAYFFIDVAALGWAGFFMWIVILCMVFGLLGCTLIWHDKWSSRPGY